MATKSIAPCRRIRSSNAWARGQAGSSTAGPVVGEQPAAIDRGSQLGHGERRGVPAKGSGRRAEEGAPFVVVQHCWTIVKTEPCCPGVDDTPTQRVECVDRDVAGD